jgi:hypothetical protein
MADRLDFAWDYLIHYGIDYEDNPPELDPDDGPVAEELAYEVREELVA